MIGNFKPYPAYKDSGVPWLGKVPEHWPTVRLKTSMENILDQTTLRCFSGLYIAMEHVESWTGRIIHPARLDGAAHTSIKRFQPGDVLFGKLRPYLGKVTVPKSHGVCVGEFLVLRPRSADILASYMESFLRSFPIINVINSSTFGAKMPRAEWSFIGGLTIVRPPILEQHKIVQFLNRVARYTNHSIHTRQNLMRLLQEKKHATIQRAVTQGLDPNVRLKPSGIDCLGRVPIHWDIRRLGQIGRFFKSTGGSKEDEVSSGIPCIRYGDLYTTHDYHVSKNRSFIRTEISRDYTLIKFGDILFATSGETIDEIGKSAVNLMQGEVRCGGDVILFRPKCQVDARFMGYSTDSRPARIQKATMGRGITIMHIYAHQLKRLAIAIPPLAEQTAIASFLDQRTSEIDGAVKATQRQIDLLREYRTRLISDVVTGKLDVREAVAQLPKQLSEAGSVDAAHAPPHMSTGSNRDSDASTEEDEP